MYWICSFWSHCDSFLGFMYIDVYLQRSNRKKARLQKKTDAFIRNKKREQETKATLEQCPDGDKKCEETVAKHLAEIAKKNLQSSDSPSDSQSKGGKTKRRSKKSKKSKKKRRTRRKGKKSRKSRK